jgi:hypothetical protein
MAAPTQLWGWARPTVRELVNLLFNLKLKILMSIFDNSILYNAKWNEKSVSAFSAEDKAQIASATVVDSNYGKSVCFAMRNGGMHYIPLDNTCDVAVGTAIDVNTAQVVVLSKQGEKDIQRIRV